MRCLAFCVGGIQQRIAANIRSLAERRGVSLNRLAAFAEVSPRQLYAFLAGRSDVTLGWLQKVADALEVDVLDLTIPGDE